MKDCCTPATSARLKAAGFPQPDPAPGQVWYVHGDTVILSAHPTTPSWLRMFYLSARESALKAFDIRKEVFSEHTFAPGVADLLRALPATYVFSRNWITSKYEVELNGRVFNNENPAEALAAAWLSENGNPAALDEF